MKILGYDSHEGFWCYAKLDSHLVHLELRWGINKSICISCLFAKDADYSDRPHWHTLL